MRIIFIRHGHPDYARDCLTELGHRQAEAAAERLAEEKIDKFFSSSCGRAVETAAHIAKGRGMDVEPLDFMREVSWGSIDGTELAHNGHPWRTAEDVVKNNHSLVQPGWRGEKYFCNNRVVTSADAVAEGIDRLLAQLGYTREGEYYRVGTPQYRTILLASHGGSTAAALSHLFNLPLPFAYYAFCVDFTSVTIVDFPGAEGELTAPRLAVVNDARHIKDLSTENVFAQ